MSWNLFIDDERNPLDVTWGSHSDQNAYRNKEWIIARDWPEVCELITSFGIPNLISFDHDLGKDKETGYHIAKQLVALALDAPDKYQFPEGFEFMVHSKNPVGAKNIQMYLDGFMKMND